MVALMASAYPHKTRHICCTAEDACLVPDSDLSKCSRRSLSCSYSITSSARPSNEAGMLRPSAFAVFRLTTNSYLFGGGDRINNLHKNVRNGERLLPQRSGSGRTRSQYHVGAQFNQLGCQCRYARCTGVTKAKVDPDVAPIDPA